MKAPHILVFNVGSSSIKAAVYRSDAEQVSLVFKNNTPVDQGSLKNAFESFIQLLNSQHAEVSISGVGHRIVHGGQNLLQPQLIDESILKELDRLCRLDPTHLPAEVAIIRACGEKFPSQPQVACFDTAFHATLPERAKFIPVPARLKNNELRRYGFHGISYSYLMKQLHEVSPREALGKVVLAHLGSGASLAAVKNGVCVDTTMGFTPTGGLLMGTRSGDLDPGVLVHLLRTFRMSADELDKVLNRESGLMSITGGKSNMQEILAQHDMTAELALEYFCYQASKHLAAMTAALGGLDTIVFSGGMGEHSPEIRKGILAPLSYLGIEVDETKNAEHAELISAGGSRVSVRVIPTDEEFEIANATQAIISGRQSI